MGFWFSADCYNLRIKGLLTLGGESYLWIVCDLEQLLFTRYPFLITMFSQKSITNKWVHTKQTAAELLPWKKDVR